MVIKKAAMDVLAIPGVMSLLARIASVAFCTKTNVRKQNKKLGTGGPDVASLFLLFYRWPLRGGIGMRRYYLASPDAKQNVDLRDFEDVIVAAVMEVMKGVEGVSVVVCEQYYEVSPSPKRNHAVAIGRKICKSGLSQHCVQVPKLFLSKEEKPGKEEKESGEKANRMGRHM